MSARPKRSKPSYEDDDDSSIGPRRGPSSSLRRSPPLPGGTSGSKKRARLTKANDDNSGSDDDEFNHEGSLETARKRRGGLNLDGYGSEAASSGGESDESGRGGRRGTKAKEEEDDIDDMFADVDDTPKKGKKPAEAVGDSKKLRYLTLDEIEGQEFAEPDPSDLLDSDGEPKIEPFHMRAEMEEGTFDASGNYVRNKRDPNAFHDGWLAGVSRRDMERARMAHERQERAELLAQAEREAGGGPKTRDEVWREMVEMVKPGETVLEALQRLAAASAAAGRGKKGGGRGMPGKKTGGGWRAKQAAARAKAAEMDVDEEDGGEGGGGGREKEKGKGKEKEKDKMKKNVTEEEALRMKEIEHLTDLSDRMMGLGYFNVYDDTYELMLRHLRREGIVPADWVPQSVRRAAEEEEEEREKRGKATTGQATIDAQPGTAATGTGPQWEYRWAGTGEDAEVYGPFDGSQMKSWSEQGFFAAGIEVRKVGGGEWGGENGVEYVEGKKG
ncbi:hypothetical protein BC938DRAFT_478434 [Jimgerdemannia flammicorona]|uniref:GYF domain-containing protein n=1 Tax=Jimgerdemannia flammicorona TaxID=994334 RepID=A0A433QYB8_9FUNG|nr:hypothetical protein BC938DRAFT_478434 [Jimgerdemannia flammicorona]